MSSRNRVTEAALVDTIVDRLRQLGPTGFVGREIPTHGRARADLAVVIDGELTAIEAKITNWGRAIAQAVLNRFWADRSYIALQVRQVSDSVLASARKYGVGVIAVGEESLAVALEAQRTEPIPSLKQKAEESIRRALQG
jgi:hypothetical protein